MSPSSTPGQTQRLVLDAAQSAGLEENALLFFLSDNRGYTRTGGITGSRNDPLRGSIGDRHGKGFESTSCWFLRNSLYFSLHSSETMAPFLIL